MTPQMREEFDGDGSSPRRGFMTSPSRADHLPAAGGHLLADRVRTHGRLTLIESRVGPGDVTPLHVHAEMDEAFYVLEGNYTVRCGEDAFAVEAGAFVYLPHGVPHSYEAGPQGGRKLIFGLPAGLEDFFRDMDTRDDWDELGSRNGIAFLHGVPVTNVSPAAK